jgi:hypothetical protein
MGGHTLRLAPNDLRSGFDHQQHVPSARPGLAVCGQAIKPEARYNRPDWPRCLDCGMVVAPPSEGEQRAMWGNR